MAVDRAQTIVETETVAEAQPIARARTIWYRANRNFGEEQFGQARKNHATRSSARAKALNPRVGNYAG